jgi:hypothetical protein
MGKETSYLNLVGFETPEQAYRKIKEWVSDLTDDEHFIRSVIFDIHAKIEFLFRQIFYHHFKPLLFLTNEENDNKKVLSSFDEMVESLSFGQMLQILWPILRHWPYDLDSIKSLNDLRNQVAHKGTVDKINYKNRNPFKDADCFAQVFFDAWATRQELEKYFRRSVKDPQELCKEYYKAYKELQELKENTKNV